MQGISKSRILPFFPGENSTNVGRSWADLATFGEKSPTHSWLAIFDLCLFSLWGWGLDRYFNIFSSLLQNFTFFVVVPWPLSSALTFRISGWNKIAYQQLPEGFPERNNLSFLHQITHEISLKEIYFSTHKRHTNNNRLSWQKRAIFFSHYKL